MEQITVRGGNKLNGAVEVEGAKNAVLPILAASMLADKGVTILHNVPVLSDVLKMINILECLNVNIVFDREMKQLKVDATRPLNCEATYEYMNRIRASVLVMGPLLARNGRVKATLPGGCNIGLRPFDLHLHGFRQLGAKIIETKNHIEAAAMSLKGYKIHLSFPSVGATQNIIMAAVKAKGTTVIKNAAREPEVVDLIYFLNKMGSKIKGAGTKIIIIEGVKELVAAEYYIMYDRIEAGTFMIAAAMTGGNVLIKNALYKHNSSLIRKLKKSGTTIIEEAKGVRVIGPKVVKPVNIRTSQYPGFPTDLQAPISAMILYASGSSTVVEMLFENRFQHLKQMQRMNGNIRIDGNKAVIHGSQDIKGAIVSATDLRGAAALVLLGLVANGVTRVINLEYLDRGYYKFHEKLQALGADIERIKMDVNLFATANSMMVEGPSVEK